MIKYLISLIYDNSAYFACLNFPEPDEPEIVKEVVYGER